jgi:outer membrane protein
MTMTTTAVAAGAAAAQGTAGAPVETPTPVRQPAPTPAAPTPSAARAPRSLSLDEALAVAAQQSEAVRIAEAGVRRARGQQYQARSQFLPQLTGSLAYQKQIESQFQAITDRFGGDQSGGGEGDSTGGGDLANSPLAAIFASENTLILGVQGSQTLFAGGRILAQNRAAGAGRRTAEIGLASATAQVKYDVTQAYFDAVLSERLLAIAESTLVQSERTFRQTRLARQVGSTSEFDLLRASVSRDNQRPVVIQARTQRDVAYIRLRQLLDLPLDEPLRLTTDIQDTAPAGETRLTSRDAGAGAAAIPVSVAVNPAEVLAEDSLVGPAVDSVVATADTSAESRAPVRQAEQNVTAQRNLLRVARGQRLPSLSLSSNYQRFAYPPNGLPKAWKDYYPNWTVTLGLSMPLFTGGRIRGEELVAQANLIEAKQQLQQAREFASLDARVAVAELEQAQAAWQASVGTAGQASRAYSIAEVRFREGLSTQVELTDSRILLQQAQANRAVAARDLQVARVKLALLRDLPLTQQGSAAQQAQQGQQQRQGQQGSQQQQQRQTQPQGAGAAGAAGGFTQTGNSGGGVNQ